MNKTNELQLFNFEEQPIRMLEKDGMTWWVAKDVCDVFGESNRNRAMQSLDDDEKGYTQIDTPGGKQKMAVVNESGLYSMLFAMQPEKARGVSNKYIAQRQEQLRKFRRWVTHEVLPSIHKTGSYIGEDTLGKLTEQLTQAVNLIAQTAAAMARVVDKLEVLTEKLAIQPVSASAEETTLLQEVPDYGLYYNNKCKLETFPAHIVNRVEEMLINMQEQQSLNFSQIARWCTVNGYTISSPAVKTYFNRHFANA